MVVYIRSLLVSVVLFGSFNANFNVNFNIVF